MAQITDVVLFNQLLADGPEGAEYVETIDGVEGLYLYHMSNLRCVCAQGSGRCSGSVEVLTVKFSEWMEIRSIQDLGDGWLLLENHSGGKRFYAYETGRCSEWMEFEMYKDLGAERFLLTASNRGMYLFHRRTLRVSPCFTSSAYYGNGFFLLAKRGVGRQFYRPEDGVHSGWFQTFRSFAKGLYLLRRKEDDSRQFFSLSSGKCTDLRCFRTFKRIGAECILLLRTDGYKELLNLETGKGSGLMKFRACRDLGGGRLVLSSKEDGQKYFFVHTMTATDWFQKRTSLGGDYEVLGRQYHPKCLCDIRTGKLSPWISFDRCRSLGNGLFLLTNADGDSEYYQLRTNEYSGAIVQSLSLRKGLYLVEFVGGGKRFVDEIVGIMSDERHFERAEFVGANHVACYSSYGTVAHFLPETFFFGAFQDIRERV